MDKPMEYRKTVRKDWVTKSRAEEDNCRSQVRSRVRIYLEKGEAGFMKEHRGRKNNDKQGKKLTDKEIKDALILR